MFPEANTIIRINKEIIDDLIIELTAQGHKLTGATFASMFAQTKLEDGTLILEGYGSFIVEILNDGVPVEKIPYTPGAKTGAGTSRYIQGLKEFAKKRFGLDDKAALGAAFAIARKHAKEGMPTKSSARHSETGQRTNAVQTVFAENKDRYGDKIGDGIKLIMTNLFNKVKSETV